MNLAHLSTLPPFPAYLEEGELATFGVSPVTGFEVRFNLDGWDKQFLLHCPNPNGQADPKH